MQIKFDKQSDSKYVRIKAGKVFRSSEEKDWLIFDYNKRGDVIGVEILNASQNFARDPYSSKARKREASAEVKNFLARNCG